MSLNRLSSKDFVVFGIILAAALFLQTSYANASVDSGWSTSPPQYTLNDGDTPVNSADPILFNVTDTSFAGNGTIDHIPVTVESFSSTGVLKDRITMTLYEVDDPSVPVGFRTPTDSGIFGVTDLVFNPDTPRVSVGNVATITQQDASKAGNGIVDTIIVSVNSTTNTAGISLNLTETGPNTGIFKGKLTFTSGLSVPNSSIQVSPGDIVSIDYLGNFENIAVTPSPDGSVNGILADVGDTIRISYQGHSSNATICVCGGGGGGGGGLIRPALVLDIIAAIGGSSYLVQPPSFGGSGFTDGLTLTQGDNKKTFDIEHYNQEIPNQVMITGTKDSMTFKTFEGYNKAGGVIHMGLYIIPRGLDMITPDSIASIELDKGHPAKVNDPNHILSNADASFSTDGTFQYTKFLFTPTKSYDKMSFLVRAWNDHMYTVDERIHDAADTPPPVKTLPAGVVKYDNFTDLISALSRDQFYKPEILAHIHDTNAVFSDSQGKVYWLYNTIGHFVTLVITDQSDNELFSYKSALQPYEIEKKGDYKFMKFTVEQLNRWNVDQIQKAMKVEEYKAMTTEISMKIARPSNWESDNK